MRYPKTIDRERKPIFTPAKKFKKSIDFYQKRKNPKTRNPNTKSHDPSLGIGIPGSYTVVCGTILQSYDCCCCHRYQQPAGPDATPPFCSPAAVGRRGQPTRRAPHAYAMDSYGLANAWPKTGRHFPTRTLAP